MRVSSCQESDAISLRSHPPSTVRPCGAQMRTASARCGRSPVGASVRRGTSPLPLLPRRDESRALAGSAAFARFSSFSSLPRAVTAPPTTTVFAGVMLPRTLRRGRAVFSVRLVSEPLAATEGSAPAHASGRGSASARPLARDGSASGSAGMASGSVGMATRGAGARSEARLGGGAGAGAVAALCLPTGCSERAGDAVGRARSARSTDDAAMGASSMDATPPPEGVGAAWAAFGVAFARGSEVAPLAEAAESVASCRRAAGAALVAGDDAAVVLWGYLAADAAAVAAATAVAAAAPTSPATLRLSTIAVRAASWRATAISMSEGGATPMRVGVAALAAAAAAAAVAAAADSRSAVRQLSISTRRPRSWSSRSDSKALAVVSSARHWWSSVVAACSATSRASDSRLVSATSARMDSRSFWTSTLTNCLVASTAPPDSARVLLAACCSITPFDRDSVRRSAAGAGRPRRADDLDQRILCAGVPVGGAGAQNRLGATE